MPWDMRHWACMKGHPRARSPSHATPRFPNDSPSMLQWLALEQRPIVAANPFFSQSTLVYSNRARLLKSGDPFSEPLWLEPVRMTRRTRGTSAPRWSKLKLGMKILAPTLWTPDEISIKNIQCKLLMLRVQLLVLCVHGRVAMHTNSHTETQHIQIHTTWVFTANITYIKSHLRERLTGALKT